MTSSHAPHILLVNPWIFDFAAYDFWAKPVGLLLLGAMLRDHGFRVSYTDCLDRFHPKARKTDPYARYGRGPYLKKRVPRPQGCEDVPRYFSRYGIRERWFREDLAGMDRPDLILMTSLMTYWYPGVQTTIRVIREIFPEVPVILGGIYASLCQDHAREHAGADYMLAGMGEGEILSLAEDHTGFSASPRFDPNDLNTYPYPGYDLQRKIAYAPLLTSRGCPFSCAYCASRFLNPTRMQRDPEGVVSEIRHWHGKYGVRDFVFYDDALLDNAESHAIPLLERIIASAMPVRFHTPNAIHIRGISEKVARLMFRANFKTLRLGLETTAFESRRELDRKVTESEFRAAVGHLRAAGFEKQQIGAYLLTGLPGQSLASAEASARVVVQSGITPILAYYSPIPHTRLWEQAVAVSRYDLDADPIFSNNAIFPCVADPLRWQKVSLLKRTLGEIRGR
jgi:radical SAM superfamily enzyme YgiQ (UPF0313 family)